MISESGSSQDEVETVAVGREDAAAGRVQVLAPGMQLGRYLIIEELGAGGMGLVLRGYDPKLQREVALKVLRSDVLEDEARARMVREARAMAKLSHPNVVAVYDVETSEQGVMLVMEYVPGQTLRQWLKQNRAWQDVVRAFVSAGRGLAAAHEAGLLHRDFKPSNVLVAERDGRVRVTDFGLARAQGREETVHAESIEGARSTDDSAEALTDPSSRRSSSWKAWSGHISASTSRLRPISDRRCDTR